MTFYRLNDGEVHLYVWQKSDGGVSCNEFTSCVVNYINMLPDGVKHVILVFDCCACQNKNCVLSSALRDISKVGNRVVEQLYLERDHIRIEADSIHAQLDQLFQRAVV